MLLCSVVLSSTLACVACEHGHHSIQLRVRQQQHSLYLHLGKGVGEFLPGYPR